jgi:predicted hydrolase (HD superfamily)
MSTETVTMLLEILKKLGCSEETMNAVKADPALKATDSTEKEEEAPEVEDEKE